MAGIDENGVLRNACKKYKTGNDYHSGPVSSTNTYLDPNFSAKYDDAIWTVLKSDIDYHRNNFMQSGYVILSLILDWPGNGDTSLGVSFHLAPFVDINSNNIYEPHLVDYPDYFLLD